jgi:ABC-type multidrug transport system ATPase subunit
MLKLKNISVIVDGQALLSDISLSLKPGVIAVLLGQSGAGKTTLLRMVAGIIQPHSGKVQLDNKDLMSFIEKDKAQMVGFLPQGYPLFDGLTVEEQCLNPLINVFKMSENLAKEKVAKMLERLGILEYSTRYPEQLSGGQRQRVALARLFCMDSKIILLDEPTSALDPANTAIIAEILKELSKKGTYIILSTQDMPFSELFCAKKIVLKKGVII